MLKIQNKISKTFFSSKRERFNLFQQMHLIFRQCKINNSVQLKNFLICVSKFLFEKYMTNFSTKALPLWTDSGFENNRNGFKKQNVSVFPQKFNFVTKIRPLSIQFSFSDPKNEEFFY